MAIDNFQNIKNFDIKKIYSLMEFFKTTFYESYVQNNDKHYTDIIFASELSKNLADKVIEHYINYTKKHNIAIEDTCPYKVLSWYGYLLTEHTYFVNRTLAVKVISTAIACMQIILEKEEIVLDKNFIKGVLRMTLLEISATKKNSYTYTNDNAKLGIGMNGFYMVFKTASICKKTN